MLQTQHLSYVRSLDLSPVSEHLHTSHSVCFAIQDRLEVQRLKAARVALERRLSQLDASSDRRVGILAPFIPENERPWRDRIQSQRLEDESIAEVLRTDKTADMSMQWDLEANEETLNELKQELVNNCLRSHICSRDCWNAATSRLLTPAPQAFSCAESSVWSKKWSCPVGDAGQTTHSLVCKIRQHVDE